MPDPNRLVDEITGEAVLPDEPMVAVENEAVPTGPFPPGAEPTRPSTRAGVSPMSRRLVLVFAAACGIVVANNYYAQPILEVIARDFQLSSGVAGLIVTATQIGYAFGLLLLVPLGDLVDRRKLVVRVLVGTTVALVASALAPSAGILIGVALVVGFTTVVAQVLVPFAASLAPDAERGRVVGTVMSGLLLGILLARTFSGFVSQIAGWRAVYGFAALAMVVLMVLLYRELPRLPTTGRRLTRQTYWQLLQSVGRLVKTESVLRRRSVYGALTFAAFSVFWTSMAFLLSRPPYGYGQAIIGLFGLLGAAGAVSASFAGRLADRGWAHLATGAFLFTVLISFGALALGGQRLTPLIVGVLLLDLGAQGTHITNQSEIYRLHPGARSRLTTVYMTAYFIGGALGSASSAVAFSRGGWTAVCAIGAAFGLIALIFWLTEQQGRSVVDPA